MDPMIFRDFSYGVYIVTTMDENRPVGCVVNSSMQITSSPAGIAVSVNHDNYTNRCIEATGMFAINILSEKADPQLIGTFGFKTSRDMDKFENYPYNVVETMPVLKQTCGYVVCKVINKMETSTHTVFMGEVIEGAVLSQEPVMTYAYYHSVIKGTSPKNAPTYLKEEPVSNQQETKLKKYRCTVCGYEYVGEEMPDDFVCPICGVGKDMFELVE